MKKVNKDGRALFSEQIVLHNKSVKGTRKFSLCGTNKGIFDLILSYQRENVQTKTATDPLGHWAEPDPDVKMTDMSLSQTHRIGVTFADMKTFLL